MTQAAKVIVDGKLPKTTSNFKTLIFVITGTCIIALLLGCFVLLLQIRGQNAAIGLEHPYAHEVYQPRKIERGNPVEEITERTDEYEVMLDPEDISNVDVSLTEGTTIEDETRIFDAPPDIETYLSSDTSSWFQIVETENNTELVDDYVTHCGVGMKSGKIKDRQITASSDYSPSFHGKYGRLDGTANDIYYLGQSYGCWLPTDSDINDKWLEVDMGSATLINGVLTQGRPKHYDQWVTTFKLSCGLRKDNMNDIQKNGETIIFSGNSDRNTRVHNTFPPTICRYLRFHPLTERGMVALRMEIIRYDCSWTGVNHYDYINDELFNEEGSATGSFILDDDTTASDVPVEPECDLPAEPISWFHIVETEHNTAFVDDYYVSRCGVGMKSGKIKDRQITASSDYTPSFHGKFGRLDGTANDIYYLGQSYGCWLPTDSDINNKWLEIDLRRRTMIDGILTQGRPKHYDQWVTTFKLSCGLRKDKMKDIQKNGETMIFNGNSDRNTRVQNSFPAVRCRYLRFHPLTAHGSVALRMEIIRHDCNLG